MSVFTEIEVAGETLPVAVIRVRLIAFDDAEQFHAIENKLMRR